MGLSLGHPTPSVREVARAVVVLKKRLKSSVLITPAQARALVPVAQIPTFGYTSDGAPVQRINSLAFLGALSCVATTKNDGHCLSREQTGVLHALFDLANHGVLNEHDLVAMLCSLRLGFAAYGVAARSMSPILVREHFRNVVKISLLGHRPEVTASDLKRLSDDVTHGLTTPQLRALLLLDDDDCGASEAQPPSHLADPILDDDDDDDVPSAVPPAYLGGADLEAVPAPAPTAVQQPPQPPVVEHEVPAPIPGDYSQQVPIIEVPAPAPVAVVQEEEVQDGHFICKKNAADLICGIMQEDTLGSSERTGPPVRPRVPL